MGLIGLLVILMLSGMWILSSLNLNHSQRIVSDVRQKQIVESFRKGLSRINTSQNELERFTMNLAKSGESIHRLAQQNQRTLANQTQLQQELEAVLLAQMTSLQGISGAGIWFKPGILSRANQSYVASYSLTGKANDATPTLQLQPRFRDYQQQGWYTRLFTDPATGVKPDAQMHWTQVYFDLTLEQALLTIATAMFDSQGELIGMVSTDWPADSIIDLVSHIEVTPGSFSFLLDQNNRNLSSLTNREDVLHAQQIVSDLVELELTSIAQPLDPHASNMALDLHTLKVHQHTYELLYSTTPAGMIFGVGVPIDEIKSVLVPLRQTNRVVLLITAMVLFAASLYLVRRIYLLMRELRTAYTDALTGLFNRPRLLMDLHAQKGNGLILINLDRFREINTLFGQACGDIVLTAFAQALQTVLPRFSHVESGVIYRLSGDEFVLYGQYENADALVQQARELHDSLPGLSIDWEGQRIAIDFSSGLVFNDTQIAEAHEGKLLTRATIALKHARLHSYSYHLYANSQSQEQQFEQNLYWAGQLREALADDRVMPFFQPIFDNQQKRITKYECLIRMSDLDGNIISPAKFLDIAHKLRLDRRLTSIMVNKSFAHFASLPYEFSINLSYSDVLDASVVELIIETLRKTDAGSRVIFEILESDSIENYSEVMQFIEQVKAFGCRIAIDDFGTGYSNFEHLLRMNVDIIKIDGSLIKSIATDTNALQVTQGIAEFAHRLGISVVAEFVHNADVQQQVERLGIDFSQGAYFGMPGAELTTLQ